MHIAMDARCISDHFPGIGRYAYNLALCLPSSAPDDHFTFLIDPGAQNSHYDLQRLGLPANAELVSLAASAMSVKQQWLVPRLVRRLGIDLYHSAYYIMPYCLPCKSVVTIHDLIPRLHPGALPRRWLAPVFSGLLRASIRAADAILVDSVATQRDLAPLARRGKLIKTVPLAADPSFCPAPAHVVPDLALTEGCPYVLYLGINKPHKNLLRLVRAWQRLPASLRQTYRLVLAGGRDRRYHQVEDYLQGQQLDGVILTGRVPGDQLIRLYQNATLFCFPSLYEGFGLPVLEAMACGTPVACSNTSSLPEVVGDAALLFDPLDTQSIAAAIEQALSDAALRQRMAQAGLAQAARFTWEAAAQSTVNLYHTVETWR